MKTIRITSDCVCDLSKEIRSKYNVDILSFYIATDRGIFKDMDEITARNIVEYFANGGEKINTLAPKPEEYEFFFAESLEKYDEIIHIAIGSHLSLSCKNAAKAAEKFSGRVRVFDSGHLSSGIGHLVIKAAEMVFENKSSDEIIGELEKIKNRVSTSFIAENADYLYRNGRVSKWVKDMCEIFKIHPVLFMKKGEIKLKSIRIGNYEKAVLRYIKGELRNPGKIEKKRGILTQASCPLKLINAAKKLAMEKGRFEELDVIEASATITSNCGANTIGILFVRD